MRRGIGRLQIPKNRFRITKSPMEISYRKNGSSIYFSGSDGIDDTKGIIDEDKPIKLVILDELGYLPIDRQGARLLFQVVSKCYERRSLIVTTNLEFSRWGSVFGDDQMAAAVIDRVVHHGRLLQFRGESYRVRHALMQGNAL